MRIETHGRRTAHQQHPSRRTAGGVLRALTQVGGELLITFGAVMLLFVVYEVYVTDMISAGRQQDATEALEDRWAQARMGPEQPQEPLEGEGILRLYAPALGPDFTQTVLEGTSQDILATGPGHYTGTALPGQPGNLAIAGHRVGHGAPFNRIDLLQSCDALIVETATEWFVYRVLPMRGESSGWAQGKGAQQRCHGVAPLTAPYPDVPGQEIVLPSNGTVIAAVPGQPRDAVPAPAAGARLITLTTCTPKFSAQQRLIVHGVLVARYPAGGGPPAELMGG